MNVNEHKVVQRCDVRSVVQLEFVTGVPWLLDEPQPDW
jgi:hypothetical protein